jgi:hypothetical protein
MILESGNILSNFRTRTLSNTIVESDITGELQTVEEFEEFAGIYGFRLNEVPRTDLQGITSVIRNEDNQVFTWVASDTPGTNQYGFDYNNPLPNVYLPSSEVGKVFTIAYKGTGGAYSSKNIISLSSLSGDLHERLINSIRNKPLDYSLVNQNIFTYNKVVTVNNLTITGTCTIRTNNPSSFGIIEIMGDLTLANFAILKTIRVMLIIHGSINVPIGTAEIIGNNGFNGGNGSLTLNGGGGGAGTGQEGDNAAVLNTGGSGGFCLIDQYSPTNASGGIINTAGANGLGGNGGGGGGAAGAGGNALLGGGSGGGGSGSFSAGVLGANSILHGSGGRGGDGAGGTIGGVGGGSGGSSVICIILGDLPTGLTMRAGKNGLNGTVGNLTGSIQPYSGNVLLYSRYTNASIPTTLDVSPNGAGYAGTLYREQIGQSAKMTGYIVNNILSELGSYGVTDFGIGNKLAGDV